MAAQWISEQDAAALLGVHIAVARQAAYDAGAWRWAADGSSTLEIDKQQIQRIQARLDRDGLRGARR